MSTQNKINQIVKGVIVAALLTTSSFPTIARATDIHKSKDLSNNFNTKEVLISQWQVWVWDAVKGWIIDTSLKEAGRTMKNNPVLIGGLGHNVFWSFCSNAGYQSYYDLNDHILCGYNPWNPGNPEGDYFSYHDVCYQYYNQPSYYNTELGMCAEGN